MNASAMEVVPPRLDPLRASWFERLRDQVATVGIAASCTGDGTALSLAPIAVGPGAAVVVHLPGRWGTGHAWALDEPVNDLRVRLALSGHVVRTVDYRSSVTPTHPGGAISTRSLLDLVATAVDRARSEHPDRPIVLYGYSLGAALAFLAAGTVGAAGLVVVDGGLPPIGATPDRSATDAGFVENPARSVRSAAAAARLLGTRRGRTPDGLDRLRWRLGHGRWWPSEQIDELRALRFDGAESCLLALRRATCPILCLVAYDRDAPHDHRAVRTARHSATSDVRLVEAHGASHEDVAVGGWARSGRAFDDVVSFVAELVR